MLLAELVIAVVFTVALLAAVWSLGHLLYMTILERRLLAARADSSRVRRARASALTLAAPAQGSPAARDRWLRGAGSPALPVGKR